MAADFKPPGFQALTPYLHIKGADKFLDFLKKAFNAEKEVVYNHDDGRIMHAQISVGGSILEFSEAVPDWPAMQSAFHLYVPDVDKLHQQALQAGGRSLHEPRDQEYGERSSAVQDPFGNNWYIATYTGGPEK
jgi:PhnB protein